MVKAMKKIFTDSISDILSTLKENKPLIHCITNPISINQCANTVLAVSARPVMAEHPLEVEEITSTASALMLNLGNISDVRMESMKLAAGTASLRAIPIVFDAVGVACSSLRRAYTLDFIKKTAPTVIKGNYSEILALTDSKYLSEGVDADKNLEFAAALNAAVALSEGSGSIVLASGKTDIVTDGKSVIIIKNGSPMLSSITGTGCMLGALTACFLSGTSADNSLTAAALACAYLGICGELAETEKGSGSFSLNLFDRLSSSDMDVIKERLDMEVI